MATSYNYTWQINLLRASTWPLDACFFIYLLLHVAIFLHIIFPTSSFCFDVNSVFLSSFILAGHVPHVPGAFTRQPRWQVRSPLRDLPWPEEPMIWGAWFNPFRRWRRPYYTCWILYQQLERDMEPSLRKLEGHDQSLSSRVRHNWEARKRVITIFSCVFYLNFDFFISSSKFIMFLLACVHLFLSL